MLLQTVLGTHLKDRRACRYPPARYSSVAQLFAFALAAVFTHAQLTLRAEERPGTVAKFSAAVHLHADAFVLAQVFTFTCRTQRRFSILPSGGNDRLVLSQGLKLTVLALVAQEAVWAAAGGLVALVDGAVASVLAVVLTGVQVTSGTSKAGLTATGGST